LAMIAIGIFLAISASAVGTFSKQMIARSEYLHKRWMFHVGAGMNLFVGPPVDASAYAFAPQVIIAPFACLDLVFNAITAPYTLSWQQEKLTRWHIIGTVLVTVGAACTSIFADTTEVIYNVTELEAQLFFRPTSIAYYLCELAAILFTITAMNSSWFNPKLRGISLGMVAGVLMGNVFLMKGLLGLIHITVSTRNFDAWARPTPYILLAGACICAIFGHVFMRRGLGEYKGIFMVTIYGGAHISAGCLSGCVVLEEMAGAEWFRYVLYWCSVALIIVGMGVINLVTEDSRMVAENLNQGQEGAPLDEGHISLEIPTTRKA